MHPDMKRLFLPGKAMKLYVFVVHRGYGMPVSVVLGSGAFLLGVSELSYTASEYIYIRKS